MRPCKECKHKIFCITYKKRTNEKKELGANFYLLKKDKLLTSLVICFLILIYKLYGVCEIVTKINIFQIL